jgi:general secretion pathway protein D
VKLIFQLLTVALGAALTAQAAETNPAPVRVPTRVIPGRITNAPPGATNVSAAATNAGAAARGAALTNRAATTSTATNRTAIQARPVTPGGAAPIPAPPGALGAPAQGQGQGQAQPGGAVVAPGFGPGGAAAARPEDDVFPPGLIKFQDSDLAQVLEIYQELTGRTVLKPTSLPATKITIKTQTELTRAEAIQALDSILSMNGITMVPQGTKFVKAVPEAGAGPAGGEFNDLPPELLPNSGTYVTHVVQLTNASPNDILPVLQPFSKAPNSILTIPSTGMLVLRDYAENVKRMLEMIAKVDVVPLQEFESVVIPIKYALAGDIAQVLGSLTAGGGGATTVGRSQTRTGLSGVGGGIGGGMGGLGGQGGLPGQPGYNPNQLGGQQGGLNTGGAAGRSSFQNRLQQIVNRAATGGAAGGGDIFVLGSTKIIADERINALLIFASKSDLSTISNIIGQLDVVLAQVIIEAIIMEVSLGNTLDYGFSYLQRQPTTVGSFIGAGAINNVPFLTPDAISQVGSNAASGGFRYAASFANFDATATALAGDSRVKILQRPRIQTSHAVEANLFVGQTRPYPTGTSYGGIGGSFSSIQQLQIGVTLSVLPLINADGLVVMDIRQKIQDVGEEVAIANVGDVPSTIDREANAKVAVRDRETVMLGGFISNSKNNTRSGVPILKDIPILGALFRSTGTSDRRTELIVLIRPTVLVSPQEAATFAAEERAKLPATRSAEKEFERSERKLLEEENRRQEKENLQMYKKEKSRR